MATKKDEGAAQTPRSERRTTVGEARKLAGAHVHWRPDGALNPKDPDGDVALVIGEE